MKDGVAVDLASGTAAGVAQLLVGHPFDTVKVRCQVSTTNISPLAAARNVIGSHGPLGFYRGMAAPLATVAAYNALLFTTWGTVERVLSPDGAPLSVGQSMVAGAIAAVPVTLLSTPTELFKCRLQAQGGVKPPPGVVYSLEEVRAGKALFRGPLQVMQHVIRYEGGLLGLFRGLVPTLLREVPGNTAYFGVYNGLKLVLAQHQGITVDELGPVSLVTAGGAAGAAFWALFFPADVIKSQLQTQNIHSPDRYRGTWDCARRLYQTQGWKALWRGYAPCMARSVPANAAAFLAFETARNALGGQK